ncbi:MAG: DCC1-like thiol-disulfide oxidoreductase family protein [Acidobacteriota bacterium]|nr:DCC1-like thiol-disulfide oxidoreductase family protein [Acidobacteriota bacterium]
MLKQPEWIFYDGSCGFCHRWVRFVLATDKNGRAFRFSPRTGETFQASIPAERRAVLPPSIVVLTDDGRVLTRSDATLHILKRLGGVWSVIARAANLVPGGARDFVYAMVARVRHRLYPAPVGLCPVVAPELRKRFAP